MKTCMRGLIILAVVCFFSGTSLAQHQITQWPDNKRGGVSITFDDGCPSQTSLAIPALNARGLEGTFFILTGDNYSPAWDSWRDAANMGHEIGSHSRTHSRLPEIPSKEKESEIVGSKDDIEREIPAQKCLSFAYPYGVFDSETKSITQNFYIGARGVICGLNSEPFDFYNVAACSVEGGDNIYAQADAASQQQKWLVVLFHSLNGGADCYGTVQIGELTAYLDYLATKNLWVGTFGAMIKYIKERSSGVLSVDSSSGEQIVLNLTDSLDDTIYDQPLTIRSVVPPSWANVTVQQGSEITTVKSTQEGTETVIYYKATPDRGSIVIQAEIMGPIITALSPASITAGSVEFTLTVIGANFTTNSVMQWNGGERPTTFVSSAQLTAAISAQDIAAAGTAQVTVFDPAPGSGTSNSQTFSIESGGAAGGASDGGGGGGGGCFIATAAYGTVMEGHIRVLIDLRDQILLKSNLGKAFIAFYSRVSPPIAEFISRHETLKAMVRWGLLPLVAASWLALHLGFLPTLALLILLTVPLGLSAKILVKRIKLQQSKTH